MSGTTGKIVFKLSGLPDLITLEFSNPYVGSSLFEPKTSSKLVGVRVRVEKGSIANVTFVVLPRKLKGDTPSVADSKHHSILIFESRKLTRPLGPLASFKFISWNTVLNPTRNKTMPSRAEDIISALDNCSCDFIALQGVFSELASEQLIKTLSGSNFPHVVCLY